MKKQYLFIVAILFIYSNFFSQTYQLSGNPVNTTGWGLVSSAIVSTDFIRLTPNANNTTGGIKLNDPINLKYCNKWKVEFDFRIDGVADPTYGKGDGLAFWYLDNPPVSYVSGSGLGIPSNAEGLMVGFDTYNNTTQAPMSKVHILYGTNNGTGNIEMNNTSGSTYHSNDLMPTLPFITGNYRHVEVNGEIDPANAAKWIITIKIDNQQIVSQSFQPSGGAVNMTQGYFGFSASTGGATSRHSIKNAKIYVDKISLLQNTITSTQCVNASSNATVNLTSFNSQFVSNPANYTFTYYILGSSTPVNNPTNFQYSANTTIKVIIKDPSSTLCDSEAQIQLNTTTLSAPTISSSSSILCFGGNVTLTSNQTTGNTWSTGATTPSITVTSPGTYTVTHTNGGCTSPAASITISAESNPNVQISGNTVLCESPTQLTASAAGTGNIYTWSNGTTGATTSVSTPGMYTVTVKTAANCEYQKSVTVTQGVIPTVQNSSLSQCSNSSTAVFNLTSAQPNISTTAGVTFDFYINQADAMAGNTNTITNPTAYTSGNATIYVRVKSATCAKVAQLQLNITQSGTITINSSSNTICFGGNVTLTSSQTTGNTWSTGATTPSITITTPGTYTVTNNSGGCTSAPASITIAAESNPNVQISGSTILCDSPTQLTASAAGTGNIYTWSNGTTGATTSVSTPGTYTVTVKTAANCEYQKSITVTQGIVPTVQNSSLSQCSNSSTAIFNLTSAQLNISTTAGVTFDFYVNQADAVAGNSNTINNPTTYTSGNATIYVRVKSATCANVAQLQLIITQSGTVTINSSSNTICFGGNVTLTSSQTTGNTWSTGATTQSITITNSGTYTVTNNSSGCTSAPASITIAAESNPNIQITGNTVLCESPTQLTASAAGTGNIYTWSNGTTGATTSVSTAGTYTVTVKTAANCEYQKSITVTQGVVPTVQNSSLSQCSNSSTAVFNLTSAQPNISTTPGVTFDFYVNQADAVAGNSNTITNPTAYTSGNATIYVRVKSATCSKVAQLQLIINTNAAPTITSSGPAICNGNGVTLTSSVSTGNVWSTGATTQSITVTTAGTYTLTNNNGTCTSSTATFTVVNGVDPNLQITGNLTFCENSSTILTATAQGTGNTYSWSNGTTGSTATIIAPGTYTVTVTTSLGCQYQKSVTVTMDPLIVVNIATPVQITCTNPQITLDASSSIYQPGATFLWTATGGGNIVSGANTLTPIVNNSGTYTLKITSTTPNGCIKQASVTVTKNTSPPNIILTSTKMTICKGESATITASGAVTYNWAGLPGTGNTQTVTPLVTTTYSVTGTGTNGCISIAPTTITINVVPEITSPLHDVEICEGHKATLDAGTATSGPSYTYVWSTGATTQVINPTAAGTYSVTISNGFCSKTFSAKVSFTIVPEILEIIYNNNSLTIKAKNNSPLPLEYSIDNGITWQSSNVFTNVLKNTQYPVRVRNRGILCDTYTEYYTFFLSNVITPNGDGRNDVLDFTQLSQYKNFAGSIFDRYGKEIFKISPKNSVWDGKYIARELPTATYWYKLSWEDAITKKPIQLTGWVLLKNRE